MNDRISFRCPNCNARLKASIRQVGQTGPCPRCRQQVFVKLPVPSDADILLVPGNDMRLPRG